MKDGGANAIIKAMQRIRNLCGESAALEFENWLSKIQKWSNSAALFNSLAMAASKQTVADRYKYGS